MPRHSLPALVFACSTLTASAAAAHITLDAPAPRHAMQKAGPCGAGAGDARGDVVTTFQGGETITVRWTETIEHPGHFRISFDPDGQDDFAEPASYDDFYANDAVLVDEIEDKVGSGSTYEQEITLPLMSCDSCTLQLVQMMTDKPPYEIGTNDLYYQCADIILEGAAATTGEEPTTGSGTTAEATTEVGTSTGEPNSTGPSSPTGGTTGSEPGTSATGSSGGTGEPMASDTAADVAPDSGCGCRTSEPGGAAGIAALAGLLLLLRRRR